MAGDPLMSQEEIERLLSQGNAMKAPGDAAAGPPPVADGGDDKLLRQDDIEKLLNDTGKSAAPPAPAPPAAREAGFAPLAGEGNIAPGDIEFLLNQAEHALQSVNEGSSHDLPPGVSSFRLEELASSVSSTENATLDLIRDVELDLKIELGRTHMYLEDVLKLRKGAVVPLDKLAGDPVDIYVNGRLIARGEVLVLNDNFCVRVAELIVGANTFA
jgi:flagellar motor switch protein FliN